MNQDDYLTKAELMLENPCMYGLDEFPDVVVEIGMLGERELESELHEVFISEMEKRDKDPTEEYSLLY
jgi:hypothetical protein